jgi:nucleoside-diphosphate-sugar epimerase
MGEPLVVAVTGASGFVGRHLCEHLAAHGAVVRALVRHPSAARFASHITVHRCDLPDGIDGAALAGAHVLVHAAWTTRFATLEAARRVNDEGSAVLLAAARAAGVELFVFLSTTSAHEAALSYYGRSKLAVEQRLDPARDLAIRAGLVLGPGGLFQRLSRSVRFGIIPVFDGGRQIIQTIHVDDLCAAIAQALDLRLTGRLVIAEPEGLSMRELLRLIARKQHRRCVFVPVPIAPLLALLRAAERVGMKLPFSSENLLGLRALRHQTSIEDLARLGLHIRTAEESLASLT